MSDVPERLNAALEGRYRIEREIGEGGMATVYLADDIRHERKVALKVLKPELAAVVGAERFLAVSRAHSTGLTRLAGSERSNALIMPFSWPWLICELVRQRRVWSRLLEPVGLLAFADAVMC